MPTGFRLRITQLLAAGIATALVTALLAAGARPSAAPGLIAFARGDGVYVMRADGGGVRALRRLGTFPTGLAWSPDGRRLAFVTPAHGNVLWTLSADGADLTRIVLHAGEAMSPSWSPDGRRIAFTALLDGGRDVWVMNADGSGQQRLARTHGYHEADVDWSPGGTRIAFSGLRFQGIHLLDLKGRVVRHLPARMFGYYAWEGAPAWSPDGRRIAFVQRTESSDREWPGRTGIFAVGPRDEERVQLTRSEATDTEPAWSPDGKRIAFVRAGGSQAPELYVTNADGSGLRRLTYNRVADTSPAWQPRA